MESIPEIREKKSLLERRNRLDSCEPLKASEDSSGYDENSTLSRTAKENKDSPTVESPGSLTNNNADYSETAVWLNSNDTTRTSLDIDKGWMDQIEASDELKRSMAAASTKRYSSVKNTYLQIPTQYDRYDCNHHLNVINILKFCNI